jgi:YfiH family protein
VRVRAEVAVAPLRAMIEGWLEADWPAPPGVRAGTTTRRFPGVSLPPFDRANFGTRGGDDPAAVARNRALLRGTLQLPSEPRWLQQVHGIAVATFDAPRIDRGPAAVKTNAPSRDPPVPLWERAPLATATDAPAGSLHESASAARHAEPQADAAVTRTHGIVLAILTADCLPVVFAADDGSVIAAAHAGWRGLAAGVLEATVDAMQVEPARIVAWLGPAAGANAYEVGEEVRAAFVDRDPPAAAAFTPTRPGHWYCDLSALAHRRLAGRSVARVSACAHSTIGESGRFFSHRRDRITGRMATLAWRDPIAGDRRRGRP